MKGHPITYTPAQIDFIKQNRKLPRRELHAAFVKKFRRRDVTMDHVKALCSRKGWTTGRTGCFQKGLVPHNKGKRMPYHPNSARTRFKKGNLPHNTNYEGHERLNKNGYIEISVRERHPRTGFERRYVLKHRWLWEKAHGPVPAGMALKCKGDKLNTDPSNWELVPRALLPRLNSRYGRGYDNAPADLTIMAVTKLEHMVRATKRDTINA